MQKITLLKIGALVPFTVGAVGICAAFLCIVLKSDKNVLWFGGVLDYSMSQLWNHPDFHIAADLLSLHLPFFALGPHLCGAGGLLYIAEAIRRKRRWALLVLFCVITVAGVNDTMGAYTYNLNTGDRGFVVPLVATSLGTIGLLMFADCLTSSQAGFSQAIQPTGAGVVYDLGRRLAIMITLTATLLWLGGYFSFFLPAYVLKTGQVSTFFGVIEVPPLVFQVVRGGDTDSEFVRSNSASLFGFSVMTAQMAWAAGAVGFGISPLLSALFGVMDSDAFLRGRCLWFLTYVSLIVLVNAWVMHWGHSLPLRSGLGREVHEVVYAAQLVLGVGLALSVGLMAYAQRLGKPFREPKQVARKQE